MLDDEAVENGLNNLFILARHLRNCLELQAQLLVEWNTLARLENEIVEFDVQSKGYLLETFEGRLRSAGLVAAYLVDMEPGEVGELMLGERLRLAQPNQIGSDAHA